MNAIAAVQSRISEMQAAIDSISAQSKPPEQPPTQSIDAFSNALLRASGEAQTTPVTYSGDLTIAGLTPQQFQTSQVTPGSALDALQRALQFQGVPYVWGGASPDGFDCSGLVQYVYGQIGISLPRVAIDQAGAGVEVPSLDQALPGDLIVTRQGGHIGIYAGQGQMVHSPAPGDSVKIGPVGDDIMTIRRVAPSGNTTGGTSVEQMVGRAFLSGLGMSSAVPASAGYGANAGYGLSAGYGALTGLGYATSVGSAYSTEALLALNRSSIL